MRDTVQSHQLALQARQWLQQQPPLPLPGSGHTLERWRALAAIGGHDLCLAKVLEAHYDALAILAELGGEAHPDALLAVWAAEGPASTLRFDAATGTVSGDKPWCSGAGLVDAALVTADTDEGKALFLMETGAQLDSEPDVWPATGMSRVPSATARFVTVPAIRLGTPGAYIERPGFWHGGAGIAAVWYGAAEHLADAAVAVASDPLRERLAGSMALALAPAAAVLRELAVRIDTMPHEGHRYHVVLARSVVERACVRVLDLVGRALGPGPMCLDADHARRWADLTVFIRQSHADRDWAWLGEATRRGERGWAL